MLIPDVESLKVYLIPSSLIGANLLRYLSPTLSFPVLSLGTCNLFPPNIVSKLFNHFTDSCSLIPFLNSDLVLSWQNLLIHSHHPPQPTCISYCLLLLLEHSLVNSFSFNCLLYLLCLPSTLALSR